MDVKDTAESQTVLNGDDVTETCVPEIINTEDTDILALPEPSPDQDNNTTEDTISAQMERGTFKQRSLTRGDNFRRRFIKRKSKDPMLISQETRDSEGETENVTHVENEVSPASENTQVIRDKPVLAKQNPVDEDNCVNDSTSLQSNDERLQKETVENPKEDVIKDGEEEGINDSITNMSLFGSLMFSIVSSVSSQLWTLVRATVTFVINSLKSEPGQKSSPRKQRISNVDRDDEDDEQEGEGKKQSSMDFVDAATQKRLFNIANELRTTEEQYVKRLGVLETLKLQTSSLLSMDVAKSIFQNIEVIHQFHRDNLLPELQARIDNWDEVKRIGDIMRKLTPFLKLYTEYVMNYESANRLLITNREKHANFDKLMKDAEENAEYGRLKVQAHMLEPVQRVPRYELLLRDYLRKLPENSPDRDDSTKALAQVAEAASHFEEMMKRDSRMMELMQLQRHFEGGVNLVHPDRDLKYTAKVKCISQKREKITEKAVHLFNDLMLISSGAWNILGMDSRYKVKYSFNLNYTRIGYGLNLEVNHTFYLSSKKIGVIELVANDMEDRVDWLERIDEQLRACAERHGQAHPGLPEDRSYVHEMLWCKRKQTLHVTSDGGKSWKKRTLAIYENGLLACFKNASDAKPLSVVQLGDFQISLGSIAQRKGQVCSLVGEGKTYHLHDDGKALIDKFYDDAHSFQKGALDIDLVASAVTMRNKKAAPDTVSTDSGIEVFNARLSGNYNEADTSWAHHSTISSESDLNIDPDSLSQNSLKWADSDKSAHSTSRISTDSGCTETLTEAIEVLKEQTDLIKEKDTVEIQNAECVASEC